MKTFFIIFLTFFFISKIIVAQNVAINDNGATPNPHAILDIDDSQNSKGILIPRLTTSERENISGLGTADEGLTVYDSDTKSFWLWDGSAWKDFSASSGSGDYWSLTGNSIDNGQFIGTTNDKNLVLKANGKSMTLYTDGRLSLITDNLGVSFGYTGLGYNNTFIGNGVGIMCDETGHYHDPVGGENVAVGHDAMLFNITGQQSVAIGSFTLYKNHYGKYNVAIGDSALYQLYNTDYNVAVGYHAGLGAVFPQNCVFIGANADGETNQPNQIAIGYNATTDANEAHIGNTSITWIGGQVTWSTYSDERIKENIQENVPGIDFIMKLRPVTYNLNIHKQNAITGVNDTLDFKGKYDIEQMRFTGFLAQEVEEAAKECNYNFSGVTAPKKDNGLYSLSYASFVVPLVKAVQEQQKTIEQLKQTVEQQQQTIEQLENKINQK